MNQQLQHRTKGSKRTLQSIIAAISLPLIVAAQLTPLAGIAVLAEDNPEPQPEIQTVSSGEAVSAESSATMPLLDPANQPDEVEAMQAESKDILPGPSASAISDAANATSSPAESTSFIAPGASSTLDASSTFNDSSTTPFFPLSTSTSAIDFTTTGTSTVGTTTVIAGTTTDSLASTIFGLDNSTTTASSTDEGDTQGPLPEGTTTIQTGDAVSLTNVLNLANTNLVNSTGSIVMANITEDPHSAIDLRTEEGSTSTLPACTLLSCNGIDSVTVKVDANASIDNNVAIVAQSGTNGISTADKAEITTGNTYAGLNLVNLANTNLIDSQYFILALNSFADVHGDIIFPSLQNLLDPQKGTSTFSTMAFSQAADISNNADVHANSGNNTETNMQSGIIETGNSVSSTNVYNTVNSLLIGGRSVAIFLKVSGSWVGELFGAPEGMQFIDVNGLQTLQIEDGSNPFMLSEYASSTIESTSTAHIANNVAVAADSGNNATDYSSSSIIRTGNSHAAANIVNIANTNVVGKNWILGIINIFGNFTGNISFGRPDLWVGEEVAGPSIIDNGTQLVYTIHLANKGDSRASSVTLASEYDISHLDVVSSNVPYAENIPGILSFDIGTLNPGDTREITFTATIKNATPGTSIGNTSRALEREPDNNLDDSTDIVTIITTPSSISTTAGSAGDMTIAPVNPVTLIAPVSATISASSGISTGDDLNGVGGGEGELFDNVTVTRTTSTTTLVGVGTKAEQTIVLRNNSEDIVPNAVFDDILYDKNGNEIKRETWDLNAILPFEEITLTYDISFKQGAHPGIYTLSSQLKKANDPKSTYAHNGTVNFVVPVQIISFTEKPLLHITENPTKTTVLSALAESFSPSIAYAAEGGSPFVAAHESISYLWWIALVFLMAALYFYLRSRRNKVWIK